MSGKILVLELKAKMLLANQISGFLNFNISKTMGGIKVVFLHEDAYLLKLQTDDVILHEWVQVCPGMPKEAIKTLRSRKVMEV